MWIGDAAEIRTKRVRKQKTEWGGPLLLTGEFELGIMVEVAIEEMHGSD